LIDSGPILWESNSTSAESGRFGITPQAIDDTLNDAFGQRQITQYFTQLNTYFVILVSDLRQSLHLG
jgi:multidrug efflux pump subunit AcrB